MKSARLEAFSDAVIAIIMTIMVLELKVPHETSLEALRPLLPILLSYVLSFTYLAIYWNNHHHMLQATDTVNGTILWANMHLLFWLSLIPFATAWIGENHLGPLPMATYGIVLLCAAIAYKLLQSAIVNHHKGENELLKDAIGDDLKGRVSPVIYLAAIPLAFLNPWISAALYVVAAGMWFIPDRRIEKKVEEEIEEEEKNE